MPVFTGLRNETSGQSSVNSRGTARRRRKSLLPVLWAALATATFAGCGDPQTASRESSSEGSGQTGITPETGNVLDIKAVGLRFEGGDEIRSGWATVRLENLSNMVHFAVIERLPPGITPEIMAAEAAGKFQNGMDLINDGARDAAMEVFGALPEWFAQVVFTGGPGLVSGGGTAEATVYLEPGQYMLECYVKTNGVFHSFNPQPGQLGMVHGFVVTDEDGNAPEPEANLALAVSSQGFELLDGELQPGRNTIRVAFDDQHVYPNFAGHDVHVVRIDEDTDLEALQAWMDWSQPGGLETPAPAVFFGGVNDMPAGTTAYFTVDLQPGDYAFIAEVPSPGDNGFLLPFTVGE